MQPVYVTAAAQCPSVPTIGNEAMADHIGQLSPEAERLGLDETIGLYAARLTGEDRHLAIINNRHPLLPFSTLRAGFRLMLHGLSTEILHGFLRDPKARQAVRL